MSDHPVRDEDLTGNPMAGYKPAVSPKHCKTMMMPAFVPEQHQKAALAPTEEMEAVPVKAPKAVEPLTVYDVISSILEVNMDAWKKLPTSVQKLMLSEPAKFRFHKFENTGMLLVPDIIYNGVRIRYSDDVQLWTLYEIESK